MALKSLPALLIPHCHLILFRMKIKDGSKCLVVVAVVVSVISYDVVFQQLARSPTYVAQFENERFHAFSKYFAT